ncbi:SAM-dependent methyltransferase [Nonomuraea sp. NPDC004702]
MTGQSTAGRRHSVPADEPCAARVYNYLLGGEENFAVDRKAARELLRVMPSARQAVQANRWFLIRALKYALSLGHTQFLDIGSGLPTELNVHQVVAETQPGARVVYADSDEAAVTHGKRLLRGDQVAMIWADLRSPEELLKKASRTLDLQQPVVVSLVGVLHFIPEGWGPAQLLAKLRNGLAAGSLLIVSHACATETPNPTVEGAIADVDETPQPTAARSSEEFLGLLQGTAHEPGLAPVWQWDPARSATSQEKEPVPGVDLRGAVVDWSPDTTAPSHAAR